VPCPSSPDTYGTASTRHPAPRRRASAKIEVSADGRTWTTVSPAADGSLEQQAWARYVRVTLSRAGDERTGIRELEVSSG
jgi:hypothetical protein